MINNLPFNFMGNYFKKIHLYKAFSRLLSRPLINVCSPNFFPQLTIFVGK